MKTPRLRSVTLAPRSAGSLAGRSGERMAEQDHFYTIEQARSCSAFRRKSCGAGMSRVSSAPSAPRVATAATRGSHRPPGRRQRWEHSPTKPPANCQHQAHAGGKRRIIQLLIESEGRYRDLVETSHDLIWQTDAEGRFTYLNAAAHEIFGLAPRD